jgi:hypothetical protein
MPEPAGPSDDEAMLSLAARMRRELVQHRKGYIVLVLFVAGGALLFPMIFPEAGPVRGAIGGFFLGLWASLAAVGGKFFGE